MTAVAVVVVDATVAGVVVFLAHLTLDNAMRPLMHLCIAYLVFGFARDCHNCCCCFFPFSRFSRMYRILFAGLAHDDAFKIAVRTYNEPKASKEMARRQ